MNNTFKKTYTMCNNIFIYGDITKSLSGQMTRKFCEECKVLRKRNESKIYQRKRRLFLGKDIVNLYNRQMYKRRIYGE